MNHGYLNNRSAATTAVCENKESIKIKKIILLSWRAIEVRWFKDVFQNMVWNNDFFPL